MTQTALRLILFALFFLVFFFAVKWALPLSILTAFVAMYIFEPLASEKL